MYTFKGNKVNNNSKCTQVHYQSKQSKQQLMNVLNVRRKQSKHTRTQQLKSKHNVQRK